MKRLLLLLSLLCLRGFAAPASTPADPLAAGFSQPPDQTKPWCYWYWISDQISREGITRDLEAMRRLGIGEALIGNIFLDNQPAGRIKVLSEEWWQLVEHAIREGGRLGVNLGLFNCPGWSQSGGPWIKPEQAMRYLTSTELRVQGPSRFVGPLPTPTGPFQEVALQAFPAPAHDGERPAGPAPRLTCRPAVTGAEKLVDGDLATAVTFPGGVGAQRAPWQVEIEFATPQTIRSLQVYPSEEPFGADAELAVADAAGNFRLVRAFRCDRSNLSVGVGFQPRAPVTLAFPAVTGQRFRLAFRNFFGRGRRVELAEIVLSPAARLELYSEKQLAKMHPTPLPQWDSYRWPLPTEPEAANLVVPPAQVIDLRDRRTADGSLDWKVPPGEWIILRTGMTPTGTRNSPASPEGKGLEVDKMNRELARAHFDAFVGQLLRRMPASERRALTRVVADSYEMGAQNWTDGFGAQFQRQYGYDPQPWLPVLTGRIVGSAERSERFLWDLRRLVADRIATDYVGGLREAAHAHGLGLWLENYGHWGFPGEFLQYGAASDRIGGEFWVTGDLGSIECRAASSCANTYGRPFVSAESFTGGPAFQNGPGALKARGDWSFCEGVNHVVLHVYIHQPAEDRVPGINAPWGTEFNRHNTWFERGRAWVDYERRCCWLLQQGWRVADVAYFIGEDTPKMTGPRTPELPPGRDFDFINAEVIERDLRVQDGRLVLPHGVSYRVLVLPPQDTMRPALLRRLGELVRAGATVVGTPPRRSPSLQDFPACDAQVRALATEIWGGLDLPAQGERRLDRGQVVWGRSLAEVLAAQASPPDLEYRGLPSDARLLFTHRRTPEADLYFVTNQLDRGERCEAVFRVAGRQPELWDAVTGERRALPEWSEQAGRTVVPLELASRQSWFVVFRRPGSAPMPAGEKNFPAWQSQQTLTGPWRVAFDPKWGGPAQSTFPQLLDWTQHADEGIRHYSGTATYRRTLTLSAADVRAAAAGTLGLDLGVVRDVATVRLNGRELGTRWTAPWRVPLGAAAHVGENELEIEIVNPWNNRLVGDLALPSAQRRTSLSLATIKPNAPLQPAGLLGPVTLQTLSLSSSQRP